MHFKKEYGNRDKHAYVEWFLPFAAEIFRVLAKDGSFVLNIGGGDNKGLPTRSLYHFELLIALVRQIGFHLAQECFWFNPAKMPMPAGRGQAHFSASAVIFRRRKRCLTPYRRRRPNG